GRDPSARNPAQGTRYDHGVMRRTRHSQCRPAQYLFQRHSATERAKAALEFAVSCARLGRVELRKNGGGKRLECLGWLVADNGAADGFVCPIESCLRTQPDDFEFGPIDAGSRRDVKRQSLA